jgi:transcriptional regulator with XRE-family HTH domain
MARWRALPGGLDPVVARFVIQLRELKDTSGRTLQELAGETGYSSSSWERYLGGRSLPPRAAVEALARIAGGDPVRMLAHLELAADAWQDQLEARGAAGDAQPETAEGPVTTAASTPVEDPAVPVTAPAQRDTRPNHRLRTGWRGIVTLGGAAVVGAVITLLLVQPSQGAAACSPTPTAVHKPVTYACTWSHKAGAWYAGNSTTNSLQLVVDMSGPDVAELQCLLQRAGITPGGIDGNFGPLTESAVIKAQKQFHLDVDGQVGPHTWAALRG